MQCPSCGNMHMVHGGAQNGNGECKNWPRCVRCGDATKADASDTGGSWKPIRLELGICNICAIWEERARQHAKNPGDTLIIGGHMYSPEKRATVAFGQPKPAGQKDAWAGFGGAAFHFQRNEDTVKRTCYSLWSGGKISEFVRDRMPDNAVFLNADGEPR